MIKGRPVSELGPNFDFFRGLLWGVLFGSIAWAAFGIILIKVILPLFNWAFSG